MVSGSTLTKSIKYVNSVNNVEVGNSQGGNYNLDWPSTRTSGYLYQDNTNNMVWQPSVATDTAVFQAYLDGGPDPFANAILITASNLLTYEPIWFNTADISSSGFTHTPSNVAAGAEIIFIDDGNYSVNVTTTFYRSAADDVGIRLEIDVSAGFISTSTFPMIA